MQQGPHDSFGAFMDAPTGLSGMHQHHDPAGRLAAHAAALQPTQAHGPFGPTVAPELTYHAQHAPAPAASDMSSNWAADFSRFAAQQPQHQHQQRQGPMFAGGSTAAANPMQVNFQNAFTPQQNFSPFFAPAGGAYAQPPQAAAVGEADFDQEMAKWMANNTASGNMAQVDAAMEQMARELELNEAALADGGSETLAAAQQSSSTAQDDAAQQNFSDLGVPELNNLSLENRDTGVVIPPEPLQEENTAADMLADDARNKSAVSEAAERLLESVQHENGEKWQNSVFLALMRDFRDGKKDIVGNEVQPTTEEGLGQGGSDKQGTNAAQAAAAPAT